MTINWYGHSCFRFIAKHADAEVRVMVDPFSKEVGLRLPKLNDDIYMLTHDHYDHNSIDGAPAGAFIVNGPGEYEKNGVQIIGVSSFHDNVQGQERGMNTIYVFTFDDIKVCHLGDLGQEKLTDEQVETMGDVDVLCVPVGGTYTISGKQAMSIIEQVEPKVIMPMHYKIPGLTIDIEDASKFLKEIAIKPEILEDSYKIQKKNLPQDETKIILFKI